MKPLLACGLGILLLASIATGGDADKELEKLQGKWIAELEGKKAELKFTKDSFAITFSDGTKDLTFKGMVKLDPSKKPKHMDMTINEGEIFKGEIARAIYELDGDTLKWCANEPGKADRPQEFPPKEGESGNSMYLVYKRAK
jgi:uncharacterized protein (TIGR03067 family)